MQKVAMFCISDKVSGGELYTIQLLLALRRVGFDVTLVGSMGSPLKDVATSNNIPFVETGLGPKLGRRTALRLFWSLPQQLRRFSSVVRLFPGSIIIFQYKWEQLLWGIIGGRKRAVYVEHGPIPRMISRIPLTRCLYVRGARKALAVFAASIPAQDSLSSLGISCQLLTAGIDDDRRKRAIALRQQTRSQILSATKAQRVGVYAGRITEEKGVFEAVRLVEGDPQTGLAIFGVGPQLDQLLEEISRTSRIQYLGTTKDALPYISAADFGILLTRDPGEGRPLFGVECVAVGTPLIGVQGSAAMEGLQAEFGGERVRLLSEASAIEFNRALSGPRASLPENVTWQRAAEVFERTIVRS